MNKTLRDFWEALDNMMLERDDKKNEYMQSHSYGPDISGSSSDVSDRGSGISVGTMFISPKAGGVKMEKQYYF